MKEKNKIAKAIKRVSFATWISVIAGIMFFVVTITAVIGGIDLSNREIELAEALNSERAGEHNLYPSVGVEYELEARVLGENTAGSWHHDLIAAEYGDVIEIRLKAVAANPRDIDRNALKHRTFYALSRGFEPLVAASEYVQVELPDGSLVDYPEDADDEHIAYFAVGIFKFTSKDWWTGHSSSAIIPLDPDMFTKLEVIAPYCDVDILMVLALIVATVVFGIVLPLIHEKGTKRNLTLVYSKGVKVTK